MVTTTKNVASRKLRNERMPSRQTIIRRRYARELKEYGAVTCGICDFPIVREKDLTVDHVTPKVLGGRNSVANFQPAHLVCNQLKAAQPDYKLTTEVKRESGTV